MKSENRNFREVISNSVSILSHQQKLLGIPIIVSIIFVIINIGFVFSNGVCCGDDAYNAVVAKNLSTGLGYALTVPANQTNSSVQLFDPTITNGPTIILFAMALIKLVGNTYWAPGIAQVFLCTILLFCIGFALNKLTKNKVGFILATIVFYFFSFTLLAYHAEQWYALLGEIPSALLIILAILVYFIDGQKISQIITGILFSLAFEAKAISLIAYGVFLIFIVIDLLISNRKNFLIGVKEIVNTLALITLGFITPILLFEIWKLIVLQPYGYIQQWKEYIRFVFYYGVADSQSIFSRIIERLDVARGRFGISLPVIFILFIFIGYFIRKEKKLFTILIAFISIISAFTLYWLCFSRGLARYYIIPLLLIVFVFIFPFLPNKLKTNQIALYALLLIGICAYNIKNIHIDYPFTNIQLFRPSENTVAQLEVINRLSANIDKRPFFTVGWTTSVDLEYLMNTYSNFSTINDPSLNSDKPKIIVVNTRLLFTDDKNLTAILSKCKIDKMAVYIYADCPSQSSP